MNKIILLGIFVAAAFAAPIDQSTPAPPAPADSSVAKFFGDAGKNIWQGLSGLFGTGKSTSPPSLPTGKSTSTSSVPADPSTPTPPAPAVTTDKNTTVKGNASSVLGLLGGFGNSFLQGVGALVGPGKSTSPPSIPADLNQSTPTPPAFAVITAKNTTGGGNASSLGGLLGDLGNIFLQGVGAVLGPVTNGDNAKEKGNATPAKNTTGGSNASSLTDLVGGLGNSLLQGVGGLLGQVTTGGTTTGGGNASSLTDVLGGLGNSLLQGVGGLLGQVSTGGITTGGGSATLLGDFLGGAGSTILQRLNGVLGQGNASVNATIKYNETKIRKPDTKPVVIRISNPRTLVTALGNYFRAHLLDTINVLFQWIQEKKHVLARNAFAYLLDRNFDTLLNNVFEGRSKEIVKEFLDILSMEETAQEAAIEKFLTENTGTIVEGILKFLTEIPDDMGILLLKLIGKHGDALSAYLIECLKGSPFEYAGYIANTTYLLTDIFAHNEGLTAWMKLLRQVVIRLANQVLKTFVGEANWFYKIVNGLFPLTPEYPNDKKVDSNVAIPSDSAALLKPQVLQPNLHLGNQTPVAVSDV
ncbi:hypothetical protein AAHC03_010038 [Spirometra sp. Aus1]